MSDTQTQSPPDKPPQGGHDEAQRKYDLELARSMHEMAKTMKQLSRKVADALDTGADRIEALTTQLATDQPASTSGRV